MDRDIVTGIHGMHEKSLVFDCAEIFLLSEYVNPSSAEMDDYLRDLGFWELRAKQNCFLYDTPSRARDLRSDTASYMLDLTYVRLKELCIIGNKIHPC